MVLRSAQVKARAPGCPATEQLALERKDIPTPAPIGMDLDAAVLSEAHAEGQTP